MPLSIRPSMMAKDAGTSTLLILTPRMAMDSWVTLMPLLIRDKGQGDQYSLWKGVYIITSFNPLFKTLRWLRP
jgi:hypothetical protein